MKKILGLTSAALLGVVALTGCSCGSKGTYTFEKIEYVEDGETKTLTCENPEGLEEEMTCALAGADLTIVLESKNEIIFKVGDEESKGYYKIEDGKLLVSQKEDGEYTDSGYVYKFARKLIQEVDADRDGDIDYTVTFKK